MKTIDRQIYFTADCHYNHRNIVKGCTNWSNNEACRDFATVEDMNNTIIENFNYTIEKHDTLYILGDVGFKSEDIQEFMSRLNCKNVHLIYGNHDKEIRKSQKLQSLFKSVGDIKEIRIEGQKIVMCHYPMRRWNQSHFSSSIHLYGHTHGHLQCTNRAMDVGLDTNEYNPYSLNDVRRLLPTFPDHFSVCL